MKRYLWIAVTVILLMNPLPILAGEENADVVDAVAIVLNPANPIKNLTTEQLRNIFTHRSLYWDALGTHIDYSIRPIIGINGGTDRPHVKEVFQRRVLSGEEFQGVEVKRGDQEVLKAVALDEAAIGLVSLSSAIGYRWVRIIDVDGEKASLDNPKYPLLISR